MNVVKDPIRQIVHYGCKRQRINHIFLYRERETEKERDKERLGQPFNFFVKVFLNIKCKNRTNPQNVEKGQQLYCMHLKALNMLVI